MADVLDAAEALVVRPGDTLIIRISPDRVGSAQEMDEFVTRIGERLPDAVVLAADQLAVQPHSGS